MMAPDGQLSLSGRSLDQSWVQAAAAALGARRADARTRKTPACGTRYADRAVSYLLSAYPTPAGWPAPDRARPGRGMEPLDHGRLCGPEPIRGPDAVAALRRARSLAAHEALRAASLPADSGNLLADDLGSSGLVWGRAAGVWWELSGRSTSGDPREAQGLVAVKVSRASGWRDLLALRPIQHGQSSTWTLGLAHGGTRDTNLHKVRGTGARVVLSGSYRRANGHTVARATWTLSTTATGNRVEHEHAREGHAAHDGVACRGASPRLSARTASRDHRGRAW